MAPTPWAAELAWDVEPREQPAQDAPKRPLAAELPGLELRSLWLLPAPLEPESRTQRQPAMES
jgi:hypothetical protein